MGSIFLAADVCGHHTKKPQLTSVNRFDPYAGGKNTKTGREDHNFATGVDQQSLSKKLQRYAVVWSSARLETS